LLAMVDQLPREMNFFWLYPGIGRASSVFLASF